MTGRLTSFGSLVLTLFAYPLDIGAGNTDFSGRGSDMKTFSYKLVLTALAAIAPIAAMPANAATATGDATVRVLQALSVTKTANLNFGNVVASASAGTIAIAENGNRTCASGLACFGSTAAGEFAVAGTVGETVTVAIDSGAISLTDGASHTIEGSVSTTTNALTLAAGTNSFKIAGQLNIGANQAAGTYAGQYSVSVNYQ